MRDKRFQGQNNCNALFYFSNPYFTYPRCIHQFTWRFLAGGQIESHLLDANYSGDEYTTLLSVLKFMHSVSQRE